MHARTGWLAMLLSVALAGCNNHQPQTVKATPTTDQTTGADVTPKSQATTTAPANGGSMSAPAANEVTLPSGLKIQDVKVGDGDEAKDGMTAHVHYTGWLTDGTQFDSSRNRGPFDFKIGSGQVIRGWDEGVKGMKVHGVRRLTVPANMGYGANGYPPVIPGNATLVFEVELLGLN